MNAFAKYVLIRTNAWPMCPVGAENLRCQAIS
jgi:hypothetical protein